MGGSTENTPSPGSKTPKRTTIPQPFHFHSDERAAAASPPKDTTPNQNGNSERKTSSSGKGSPSSDSKRESKLTSPKPFRFESDQRAATRVKRSEHSNETYVSLAQSTEASIKGLRHDDLSDKKKWESKLTIPSPPTFESDKRAAARASERSDEEFVPMANSSDLLARGLRDSKSDAVADKEKWENKRLTIPEEPHFSQAHARPLPKSAEELEQEEMEYYKSNRFKAKPIPKTSLPSPPKSSPPKSSPKSNKPVVESQPFHFRSDERAAVAKPREHFISKEESDLLECQNGFHALPMPKFQHPSPDKSPEKAKEKKVLLPVTPTTPAFRARPVPKSTYTPSSADRDTTVTTQSPAQMLEQEMQEEAKPFVLQSATRHEAYQQQLAAKIREEELEKKRLTEFHARPFKRTAIPLEIVKRQEEEKRRKLAEEEAELKRHSFKAKPMPKSVYPEYRNKTTPEKPQGKKKTEPQGKQKVDTTPSKHRNGEPPRLKESPLSRSLDANKGSPDRPVLPYWFVFFAMCLFRIANTFLVQSYFDPDEFWQTMEPAYCEAFNGTYDCPGFTWEWKRRPPPSADNFVEQSLLGPARSYISVLPTYLFFGILKAFEWDSYWLVSRGPMLLAAITVAAPIDLAVWYTARWLQPLQPATKRSNLANWCVFCTLFSWFNGYASTRTFANCQETALLAVAIALMSPELIGDVNAGHSLLRGRAAFLAGGISVALRFTSLAAFVPMGILLALRSRSTCTKLGYVMSPCATFGIAGLAIAMAVDRYFFGFWTLPLLGNFHFNLILDRASLYGSHPGHWYFSTGVPALAGLLLPLLLLSLWRFVRGRVSYGERNLWIISLCYLVTLSFNAHKELRYIQPVLPLFCLLAGSHLRTLFVGNSNRPSNGRAFFLGSIFITANLLAVLYLGLFHQTGPILVNRSIVSDASVVASTSNQSDFTIHYLTGACHSTPLHSQLHAPPLSFDTWSLDCSPECRADPDLVCESELFARDPVGFIGDAYFPCVKLAEEEETCSVDSLPRPVPDYVVTFSTYEASIRPQLESLGLHEVARFPHHINGARVGSVKIGPDFLNDAYRRIVLAIWLEVSLEEMVLFSTEAATVNSLADVSPVKEAKAETSGSAASPLATDAFSKPLKAVDAFAAAPPQAQPEPETVAQVQVEQDNTLLAHEEEQAQAEQEIASTAREEVPQQAQAEQETTLLAHEEEQAQAEPETTAPTHEEEPQQAHAEQDITSPAHEEVPQQAQAEPETTSPAHEEEPQQAHAEQEITSPAHEESGEL
jgi:phosphatidylinositol glycan class B